MENKKRFIVFALVVLLITVIGATYAYFMAQKGSGGSANINVEAGTTDSLTFTNGSAITIDANSDNFKSGEPNQKGETEVAAHLVANNGNNTASETYNVYLNLIQNPFVYTRPDSPELILQVIGPDGKPLKTLEDETIKYVSLEEVDEEEDPLDGFDITTATGLIPIKLNEPIEANPSEDAATNGKADEEWQIKIILINRDYDQQLNTGKTFSAQAVITHEILPNIKVETADITSDSMKVIATISNYDDVIDNVEFKINADDNQDWHKADNESEYIYSYTFEGLTENKKYEVSTKISLSNSELLNVIEESITPKKTLADACPNGGNLAECVISLYNKNSKYEDTKLYYHNASLENGANDLSYRYTGGDYKLTEKAASYPTINDLIKLTCDGVPSTNSNDYCATNSVYKLSYNSDAQTFTTLKSALRQTIKDGYLTDDNIKNYVCFGEECETNKDNLYRIIGAFKVGNEYQIKLIKADEAGKDLLGEDGDFVSQNGTSYNTYLGNHNDYPRYAWDKNGNNVWSESALNIQNLNTFYLQKLGGYADKIVTTSWQVGGMTDETAYQEGAHTAYDNELGTLKQDKTYPAKIGLMYVSDYYYGVQKNYWDLPGYVKSGEDYRKTVWDNWLWIGDDLWFITPSTSNSTCAFHVYTYGGVLRYLTTVYTFAARPSFYLNANVKYVSGLGTSEDPIIIN